MGIVVLDHQEKPFYPGVIGVLPFLYRGLFTSSADGRHYSTPPAAFVGRNSSLEYGTQRIQQYRQEEKDQQDRANKSISQIILARLRASRRPRTASTVMRTLSVRR